MFTQSVVSNVILLLLHCLHSERSIDRLPLLIGLEAKLSPSSSVLIQWLLFVCVVDEHTSFFFCDNRVLSITYVLTLSDNFDHYLAATFFFFWFFFFFAFKTLFLFSYLSCFSPLFFIRLFFFYCISLAKPIPFFFHTFTQ